MKGINIYISTCDKTKWVLKPAIMLMEKYLPRQKSVVILGYSELEIPLPVNYSFVSMQPAQTSIDNWAKDIHSIIKEDSSEHIVFLLDDMLILDHLNEDIFDLLLTKMQFDKSIVRCDLGMDLQFLKCKEIHKWGDCILVEKTRDSGYWNTTQPSIWRKDYLLEILSKSTNPWNFETAHSIPVGKRILGTRNRYAMKGMIETACSALHPDMFNVMGLKKEDIAWLIKKDVVAPERMQWGMRKGFVLPFLRYGLDFTMDHLKQHQTAEIYNHYKERYGDIY